MEDNESVCLSELGEDPPIPLKNIELEFMKTTQTSGCLSIEGMFMNYLKNNLLLKEDDEKLKIFKDTAEGENKLVPVYGPVKKSKKYYVMNLESEVEEMKSGNSLLDIDMNGFDEIVKELDGVQVDLKFSSER